MSIQPDANIPASVEPEKKDQAQISDNQGRNFRMLEAARDREMEGRIRAEQESQRLRQDFENLKESLAQREQDPLDAEDIDPELRSKLQKARAKDRSDFAREAEKVANRTYDERKKKDYLDGHQERLQSQYSDFDQVLTSDNAAYLREKDPLFFDLVDKQPDIYDAKKKAYLRIKELKAKEAPKPSIKEKVQENYENSYYMAGSSGTTTALDFDVRTKSAKEAAYAKLRAAQRRQ